MTWRATSVQHAPTAAKQSTSVRLIPQEYEAPVAPAARARGPPVCGCALLHVCQTWRSGRAVRLIPCLGAVWRRLAASRASRRAICLAVCRLQLVVGQPCDCLRSWQRFFVPFCDRLFPWRSAAPPLGAPAQVPVAAARKRAGAAAARVSQEPDQLFCAAGGKGRPGAPGVPPALGEAAAAAARASAVASATEGEASASQNAERLRGSATGVTVSLRSGLRSRLLLRLRLRLRLRPLRFAKRARPACNVAPRSRPAAPRSHPSSLFVCAPSAAEQPPGATYASSSAASAPRAGAPSRACAAAASSARRSASGSTTAAYVAQACIPPPAAAQRLGQHAEADGALQTACTGAREA